MIDVVDIKAKVKNKEIEFYLFNDNIYCKNNNTEEIIIVGNIDEQKGDIYNYYFALNLSQKEIDFILYDTWNKNKKLSKEELKKIVSSYLKYLLKDKIEDFNLLGVDEDD